MNKKSRRFRNKTEAAAFIVITAYLFFKSYSIRIFFKHLFYLAAYLYKFIYKLGFKMASR